ncbi:MAG: alpha/beta fold hydrolase [Cyanobacteriota/Melainabacteria group bacterium]
MHERGTISSLEKPEIHTERVGVKEGVPIIVMHGWGQNLESMRTLGELLGSRNPIWLMDLPGFGKSALPAEDSDTVSYAEMLKLFMEANGIERAHLLGILCGRVSHPIHQPLCFDGRECYSRGIHGLKRKQDLAGRLKFMRIKTISKFCKNPRRNF